MKKLTKEQRKMRKSPLQKRYAPSFWTYEYIERVSTLHFDDYWAVQEQLLAEFLGWTK
jgi:hypothetical protein